MDLVRDKDCMEFKLHHKSYEFNNKCKVKKVPLKKVTLQENLEQMEPPQLKELPNLKKYLTLLQNFRSRQKEVLLLTTLTKQTKMRTLHRHISWGLNIAISSQFVMVMVRTEEKLVAC